MVLDMNPCRNNQNPLGKRIPSLVIEKERYPMATHILLDRYRNLEIVCKVEKLNHNIWKNINQGWETDVPTQNLVIVYKMKILNHVM